MNIRDLSVEDKRYLESVVDNILHYKNELNKFITDKGIDKNLLLSYVEYYETTHFEGE